MPRVIGEGDRIDKLGRYFEYFDVYNRFGITFERFVYLVDSGRWLEAMESNRLPLYHKGKLEEVSI